jgi:hypothetical protein
LLGKSRNGPNVAAAHEPAGNSWAMALQGLWQDPSLGTATSF